MTLRVFFANLLWFLSTLPDTARFLLALRDPAQAQRAVARRRRSTREEDILLYEPTSGSTGGTKWIPYTEQLRREFMRAVNPWMASIYLRHPGLLFGTHYWSISPYTEVRQPKAGPRRGFAEDRDYLGSTCGRLTRALFPVTSEVAKVRDPEEHRRLTAQALVRERRLGLISVWHPSAFLRLLDYMEGHAEELAAEPVRSALKARRYAEVWPQLKLISCWDAAFARAAAERLRELFPQVEVEGKGLLATEGVVTFPWFGRHVAAVTSHTLNFLPPDHSDASPACDADHRSARALACDADHRSARALACGPGELQVGVRYEVVLTTGNGFTDYRLGDVVECTGFAGKVPVLEFLHRAGGMVDLHGEKMHPAFAQEVLDKLSERHGRPRFATLVAREDHRGYRLRWEGQSTPSSAEVEALLGGNYHYLHAVNLGQLEPVQVEPVVDGLAAWCREHGQLEASAKVPPLSRARDGQDGQDG